MIKSSILLVVVLSLTGCVTAKVRGTGDLGLVVERSTGSLLLVETSNSTVIKKIEGLGDLSHASIVYTRDARYGFVFGRDGGLTKVDLLSGTITKRVIQAGNSIGGAISQDGKYVAVSNYKPGGVKIFNVSDLTQVADIPAVDDSGRRSKVVGLVDAPGGKFVFSLFEAGEIWIVEMKGGDKKIWRIKNVGKKPYDALITPEGRYYIAGLFGEDGMALVDLWKKKPVAKRILGKYGKGMEKLPVYKMPHLEGWAVTGFDAFAPGVGRHHVVVVDTQSWKQKRIIKVAGQPVFAMGSPDGRYVFVNFAFPHNDRIQVIDTQTYQVVRTLKPGKGVLHMEFTPRGERVWMSVRDENRIDVFNAISLKKEGQLEAVKPSGIFFTSRAHKIGL